MKFGDKFLLNNTPCIYVAESVEHYCHVLLENKKTTVICEIQQLKPYREPEERFMTIESMKNFMIERNGKPLPNKMLISVITPDNKYIYLNKNTGISNGHLVFTSTYKEVKDDE